MGDYSKCKWCGKTFEKGGFNKFKGAWTLGIAGKEAYCSKRCETEASGNDSNQPPIGSAQTNSERSNVVYQAPQKTEAEVAYEIERMRKEDEKRDKINERADARKQEKIRIYEIEGKKFLLFITEKPIFAGILFFVLLPILLFFVGAILSRNAQLSLVVSSLPMFLFLGLYFKDLMKK